MIKHLHNDDVMFNTTTPKKLFGNVLFEKNVFLKFAISVLRAMLNEHVYNVDRLQTNKLLYKCHHSLQKIRTDIDLVTAFIFLTNFKYILDLFIF